MSNIVIIKREFSELMRQAQASKEKGWRFKVSNYRKVINILGDLELTGTDVTTTEEALYALRGGGMALKSEKPPNWKSKILLKIEEILQKGYLQKAEDSRNDPKTMALKALTSIPEIGPSKAAELYAAGLTSIDDLLAKPELVNRKQQIGLRHYRDLAERIPREEMDRWMDGLRHIVGETLCEMGIKPLSMDLVGSYRRGHQTSGDVDFYLSLEDDECLDGVMENISDSLVAMGGLQEQDIFSQGDHKLMCVARLGPNEKARHLDIFIFHRTQYPFAMMYATGSGEFNVRFRNHALGMGWSLSDKALCAGEAGGPPPTPEQLQERLGKKTISREKDIFKFLGLNYIKPAERTPTVTFSLLDDIEKL